MADPNLSEIVATTLRNRSGKATDNMSRNNAILARMNSRGNIKKFSGGRTIVEELEYANNKTYTRYSGYQAVNISPSTIFSAAEFPIRQTAVAVSISGLEELQNAGKERVIELLGGRVMNAEKTMQGGLAYDMYSDGSLTGQINGLASIVDTTPATGTVGGIDAASFQFWRNVAYSALTDGGAAVSAGNVFNYFMALWVQLCRGSDKPDLILTDNTVWTAYAVFMQGMARIMNENNDLAKAGFSSLKFMTADVVLDGGFQGTTDDGNTFGSNGAGAVGGAPASTAFMLNTNYVRLRPHAERNMVPLRPDRFSINQDAMIRLLGWAGNMTVSNRFLQGVLTT
jgi:hypothetical protein